ncbi:MAG TPA: hypothetical protein DEQ30_00930 [Porphyromonadaceae bacterium]|nr:hypothetical protein [Porphyromonadaceae bacterium]
MRYYPILFLIHICLLQAGCNKETTKNANEPFEFYTIDFEQGFDTERQMFISEIADSVEYIELKTPDDVIITRIWDIKQLDSLLIIRSRRDAYIFHKNGQFIKQIGARGQGPGEYISLVDLEIDRKKKEIVITDTEKLLFCDLNGNFLRSQKRKPEIIYLGISDSVLWMGDIEDLANKYKAVAVSLDRLNDTLACIPNPMYGITKPPGSTSALSPYEIFFYYKNDLLYFKGSVSNDTIWKISGVHAEPYAFIDLGKYKLPLKYEPWYSSFENYVQNYDPYWSVLSVIEDDRYFYLFSNWKKIDQNRRSYAAFKYIVYDKKEQTVFSAKDKNDIGITDNIQGGPPIWPRWISNEYYMSAVESSELLEKTEAGEYTPSASLQELLSRIDEDSNDLIILCQRKK